MTKNSSLKQTAVFMTAIFTVLMLTGFVGVYAVDYEWKQNYPSERLFITDGDTQFVTIDYDPDSYPDPYYPDLQTCQRELLSGTPMQYNRTAVYTGNNTYSIAVNETSGSSNSALMVMEIPNVENWIMSDIWINMSKNTDPDITLSATLIYYDDIHIYTNPSDQIYLNYAVGSTTGTDYETHLSIPLATALSINNNANQFDNVALMVIFKDKDNDGLSAFAWEMTLTIDGQKTSDMSIADTVSWVLGGSVVINIIAIAYMTDGLDIIPKKKSDASAYRRQKMSAIGLPLLGVGMFGIEMADLTFDLLYFLPITMLILASIMAYYKRITIPMAIFGVLISLGITVLFAPYQAIVLTPLVNCLWFGYSWTFPAYLPIIALAHVISLFTMGILAIYNLYISHGKSLWL